MEAKKPQQNGLISQQVAQCALFYMISKCMISLVVSHVHIKVCIFFILQRSLRLYNTVLRIL